MPEKRLLKQNSSTADLVPIKPLRKTEKYSYVKSKLLTAAPQQEKNVFGQARPLDFGQS